MCKYFEFNVNILQRGQALLAVILVMVVALTVGLSIATRNITNLRLTTDEQASQRALSAAEAGVEQALKVTGQRGNIIGPGGTTPTRKIGDANIENVKITGITNHEILLNDGNPVQRNESIDVWLSNYGTLTNAWAGHLNVYWHTPTEACAVADEPTTAALDIYAVYMPVDGSSTAANSQVRHYPIDPCPTRRSNNLFCPKMTDYCYDPGSTTTVDNTMRFVSTTYSISGKPFSYQARIGFGNPNLDVKQAGILVRITPLYADTVIGIRATDFSSVNKPLPEQGTIIESTGTSGNIKRKISVFRPNPTLPNELFYTIFAP